MTYRWRNRRGAAAAATMLGVALLSATVGWPLSGAGSGPEERRALERASTSSTYNSYGTADGGSAATIVEGSGGDLSTSSASPVPQLPILGKPSPEGEAPPPTSDPGAPPAGHDSSWPAGVARGTYRALVDVRADQASRVDVTVAGQMVGTYRVGPTTRTLTGLVFVDGPSTPIGIRSSTPVQIGAKRLDPVAPTFTTRGTSLIAPDGKPFRFTGVNRSGYELSPGGTPSLNQFGHESEPMWRWGINAVRLPVNQEFWHANCEVPTSWAHSTPQRPDGSAWRYHDVIDEEIRRFAARGILVLLDLHATSRGQALGCSADGEVLREMPDDRSLAFWRSVAARYKSQPYVAFDLFNEPHLDDSHNPPSESEAKRIWRDGGVVSYRDTSGLINKTASYNAVGMQTLYDAVRATGATNLVFAAGLHYAHRPEVVVENPLDATGLVASVHLYCLSCPTIPRPEQTQYFEGERPGEPNRTGVIDRYPTVATEFGTDEWWDSSDNRRYLDYFAAKGLGWAAWAWAGGGTSFGRSPYGILAETTSSTPGRTPGQSGLPIWQALAGERQARGV